MKVRDEAIAQVRALVAGNAAAAAAGGPVQLLYRMLYLPEDGMFKLMPDELELGRYLPEAEDVDGVVQEDKTKRFMWEGQQYRVGDFVYLLATCAPACSSISVVLCACVAGAVAHIVEAVCTSAQVGMRAKSLRRTCYRNLAARGSMGV